MRFLASPQPQQQQKHVGVLGLAPATTQNKEHGGVFGLAPAMTQNKESTKVKIWATQVVRRPQPRGAGVLKEENTHKQIAAAQSQGVADLDPPRASHFWLLLQACCPTPANPACSLGFSWLFAYQVSPQGHTGTRIAVLPHEGGNVRILLHRAGT